MTVAKLACNLAKTHGCSSVPISAIVLRVTVNALKCRIEAVENNFDGIDNGGTWLAKSAQKISSRFFEAMHGVVRLPDSMFFVECSF